MGENELYWNATGLAVDSVLCGCDDLECIEKRKAADETFVPEYVYCQVCGETDDSRVIHNHPVELPDQSESQSNHHFEHLPCSCSRCAPTDSVLLEFTPDERHEFHMTDRWHAYCVCGWYSKAGIEETHSALTDRYREHLG